MPSNNARGSAYRNTAGKLSFWQLEKKEEKKDHITQTDSSQTLINYWKYNWPLMFAPEMIFVTGEIQNNEIS